MKINLILTIVFVISLAANVFAQNSIKIFDPVAIDSSDTTFPWTYNSAKDFAVREVYLSCPATERQATLSGPNGGTFAVDNFLTVNGRNICAAGIRYNCFTGLSADPMTYLGEPMEMVYHGMQPVNISQHVATGINTFALKDYGYNYGNTEVYLNTNCSFVTQVCHRNQGNAAPKTLTIGAPAVEAHLAHGDTEGPCAQ